MFKLVAAIVVVLGVLGVHECAPAYQVLEPRDGYIPVYIQHGNTPLSEINPMLAEAFEDLGFHLIEKEDAPNGELTLKQSEELDLGNDELPSESSDKQAFNNDDQESEHIDEVSSKKSDEEPEDELPSQDALKSSEEQALDNDAVTEHAVEETDETSFTRERRETVEPDATPAETTTPAAVSADGTHNAIPKAKDSSDSSSDSSEEKKA